jgi:hypothetical protein
MVPEEDCLMSKHAKAKMTYNLQSSPIIYTPGIVEMAVNGGRNKSQVQKFANLLEKGWKLPPKVARGIVTGKIPYTVDGETVVVIA